MAFSSVEDLTGLAAAFIFNDDYAYSVVSWKFSTASAVHGNAYEAGENRTPDDAT